MLIRKTTLLGKIEATYGVDAAPTAALNAIRARNVQFKEIGEELVRDFDRSSLSPLPHVIGEKYGELSFETELKGSGAAGTPPEIGPCFRSCGFAETIIPATSVAYDPSSASFSSGTFYAYRDGILHKFLGARGTADFDLPVGKYGLAAWKLQGLYVPVADAALVAGTYNATLPPVIVSAAFSVGGYSAVATKLAISLANELAFRKDLNSANGIREILITGWAERGGSFDPEAVLEATHPFFGNWAAGVQAALTVTIGSAAGNRCVVTGPKLQYKSISPADRDKLYAYEIPFRLAGDAGDDEAKFLFN